MLAEAAGFALLAAISPTALILMAVFLGSASPRATAFMYVAGAIVMTIVTAIAALIVIRTTGLDQPRQHDARYGLRLGLGILAAIAAVVVALRKRRPPDPNRPQKGIISRLIANPSPRTAFISGLLIFAPGATFIAAVQVIATARAGVPVTALGLGTVVVITVLVVWLPLVAFLAAPDATTRLLKRLNGWLRANGKLLLVAGLAIAAVALIVNGALGAADVI